jgi:phage gp29-like protein
MLGGRIAMPPRAESPLNPAGNVIDTRRNGDAGGDVGEQGNREVFRKRIRPPRVFINPIRGLTVARAVMLLEQAQYGFNADLQWTFRSIERKEPVIRSLKERRLSAIRKLKVNFVVDDEAKGEGEEGVGSNEEAQQQVQVLKETYRRIDNVGQAIKWLALATFRGYSHLEKHYDAEMNVVHLEPVPQWHWCKTYPFDDWKFNRDAYQTNVGEEVDPGQFVVREVDDPLDEIGLIVFLRKNLTQKDWDSFCETFGIPSLFAEAPVGATQSDVDNYLAVLDQIIGNGRGALPPGFRMQSTAQQVGATLPFEPHLGYCDKMMVLAGTGGKLTMLSEATGIGSGAAEEHADVFQDIAISESEEICEVLHAAIDVPALQAAGFERPLAKVALEKLKTADRAKAADFLATLASAGYRTTDDHASELVDLEVRLDQGGGPGEGVPGDEGQPGDQEGGEGGVDIGAMFDRAGIEDTSGGEGEEDERAEGGQPAGEAQNTASSDVWAVGDPAPRLDPRAPVYPAVSQAASSMTPDPPPYRFGYPTEGEVERYRRAMQPLVDEYQRAVASGLHKDLGPVRTELEKILELDSEDEAGERLAALDASLPGRLRGMMRDSSAALALRAILEDGVARGASPTGRRSLWSRFKGLIRK